LKTSYPDLFDIASSKDAWVVNNMQFRDGNIHWNVILTRPMLYWKADVVFSFFEMYYLIIRQGDVGTICWNLSKRCKFDVKSYSQVLIITTGSSFSWKSIWRVFLFFFFLINQ
jgi:hypothetical protein